jgi:hypothetical protein
MKHLDPESYLIVGVLLATVVCSIPFTQVVDTTKTVNYVSNALNQIEVGFGGPRVIRVDVVCNTTAEIRFMYQNGTWISTQNVLLASVQTMAASYNFNAEHTTIVIQVSSNGPFEASITYTYHIEMELSIFSRVFYSIGTYSFNQD